jgi:hypothetical protein
MATVEEKAAWTAAATAVQRTLSQWGSIHLNCHAPPARKQARKQSPDSAPATTTAPVHG